MESVDTFYVILILVENVEFVFVFVFRKKKSFEHIFLSNIVCVEHPALEVGWYYYNIFNDKTAEFFYKNENFWKSKLFKKYI